MTILGVDTGSRWCAAVATDGGAALVAGTIDVNPTGAKPSAIDVNPVVAWLLGCAAMSGADRFVVEHAEDWTPWPGMAPGALHATARNWHVCDRIVRELRRVSPLPVETIHVNAVRGKLIPSHIRKAAGSMDAKVEAALAIVLSPESFAVVNTVAPPCTDPRHQRDAVAAALAWAPPEEKPVAEPRPKRMPGEKAPRKPGRNANQAAKAKAAGLAKRAAVGCVCGRGHHRGCPLDTRPDTYRKRRSADHPWRRRTEEPTK